MIIKCLFRLSRWNHTKIFSNFGDGESEGSDAEYTDDQTLFGQQSKATLYYNSKASSSRSVSKNLNVVASKGT